MENKIHDMTIDKLNEMFGSDEDKSIRLMPFKTENLIRALDVEVTGFTMDEYGNTNRTEISLRVGGFRKRTTLFLSMTDSNAEEKNTQIMKDIGLNLNRDEIKTINSYVQIYSSIMMMDKVVEMISKTDEEAQLSRKALNYFGNFLRPRPWG